MAIIQTVISILIKMCSFSWYKAVLYFCKPMLYEPKSYLWHVKNSAFGDRKHCFYLLKAVKTQINGCIEQ